MFLGFQAKKSVQIFAKIWLIVLIPQILKKVFIDFMQILTV